jgi:hypothetical protein
MLLHNIFIKKHIVRTQTEKRERVANSFIFFSQRKESLVTMTPLSLTLVSVVERDFLSQNHQGLENAKFKNISSDFSHRFVFNLCSRL